MVRVERMERDTHLYEPKDLTYSTTTGVLVDLTAQKRQVILHGQIINNHMHIKYCVAHKVLLNALLY